MSIALVLNKTFEPKVEINLGRQDNWPLRICVFNRIYFGCQMSDAGLAEEKNQEKVISFAVNNLIFPKGFYTVAILHRLGIQFLCDVYSRDYTSGHRVSLSMFEGHLCFGVTQTTSVLKLLCFGNDG